MVPGHEIARIAARTGGYVTHAELRELGLTDMQIIGLVRRGILHRVFRGIYAYGNPVLRDLPYLGAALASCPAAAFITGDAAEAVYGLRRLYRRAVEITLPRAGGRANRGPLILRRTTMLDPLDVTTYNGLRVATFPRLLLDQAIRKTPGHIEKLLEKGVRKQIYDPHALEAAIGRHHHRPGTGMLRAAAIRFRPGPDRKSELERSFDRWKRTRPDIPDPLRNTYIGPWEIDCLWPEQRVILELDGRPYHTAVADFDKDSLKRGELMVGGYKPLGVTDFRWEWDRDRVVGHLLALLGL